MALFDEDSDRTEFATELNRLLGIPEGKTFTDLLQDAINPAVNAVDKRAGKKIEEAIAKIAEGGLDAETLEGIKALVASGGKPPGDDGDGDGKGDGGDHDFKSLPAWARQLFAKQDEQLTTFGKKLENESKAREDADNQRLETEHTGMRRFMSDKTREAAVAAGLDANKMDFFMPYAETNALVRGIEDKPGKFEMRIGEDTYGDPVYKPLTDAMGEFAKTDQGKNFRPPTGGTPPKTPGGDPPKNTGDMIPFSSIQNDPKALREASAAGTLDVNS